MEEKAKCCPAEMAELILRKEREALEQWNAGNPSGYLALYAEDFTYFDSMQEKRVDGFPAIRELYESLRGNGQVDRYEIKGAKVQHYGNTAVLTYNLDSWVGETLWKWNCTEVYIEQQKGEWKIIHNHWSLVQPLRGEPK